MEIGEKIKLYRMEKGMTQKELADALNISYVNISQWERGKRNPKIETLQKIAEILGISTADFLEMENGERVTMPIETLNDICNKFVHALEPVMMLDKDEQKQFYEFLDLINVILRYSRSIGKATNLMGQSTAVDLFISASIKLNILNSKMLKQAYDKFYSLNPDKKPGIKINIHTK